MQKSTIQQVHEEIVLATLEQHAIPIDCMLNMLGWLVQIEEKSHVSIITPKRKQML